MIALAQRVLKRLVLGICLPAHGVPRSRIAHCPANRDRRAALPTRLSYSTLPAHYHCRRQSLTLSVVTERVRARFDAGGNRSAQALWLGFDGLGQRLGHLKKLLANLRVGNSVVEANEFDCFGLLQMLAPALVLRADLGIVRTQIAKEI